ncbi:hypothetical protein KZ483_06605 [Paenibacillus sp. sptzw28]|uniref:hypothetical protein n=1 Tax=Paenibacillus sp. sptzw28 TaxID=715179 RepID=UPI001C6F51C2|nr:hypothetical protein [Paenibacillus sp. sptzw28]QYR22626.1 hypothetical protein KZ483_06605 [Paenibacillus sp. sptzw28]
MPQLDAAFMMMEIEHRIRALSSLDDLEIQMVNMEWLLGRIHELRSLHQFFTRHQAVYGGGYPVGRDIDDCIIRPEIRQRFGLT